MVVDAVRVVTEQEPYASRFTFEVFQWQSEQGQWAEERYPFGRDKHGFVVVTAAGELLACRPSHFYGEEEIQADLDAILAGGIGHMPDEEPK